MTEDEAGPGVLRIPLADLAARWCCTPRQARRRLTALQDQGLVEYVPGRGRGHLTVLRFRREVGQEVLEAANTLTASNDTEGLIRLLALPLPPEVRWQAAGGLRGLLGWQRPSAGRDVLRLPWRYPPTTISPYDCNFTFEAHLVSQMSDTLLRYDPGRQTVGPHLAHYWGSEDGGKTWVFHLRKGVQFHHGRELTSADVVHSFKVFRAQGANYGFLLEGLEAACCPDPYTVQVSLNAPNPFFPHFLANVGLAILPRDVPFDEWTWTASGPFRLAERTPERLRFTAFDGYFLGRPLVDEVEIVHLPGLASRNLMWAWGQGEPGREHHHEVEVGVTFLLAVGRSGGPMEKRALRRAVAGLLDVERMWHDLGRDPAHMRPAGSFVPWRAGARPQETRPVPELLREAGYDGAPLRLLYLDKPKFREEAEWIAARAAEYGLTILPVPWPFDALLDSALTAEADLILSIEVFSSDTHLSFIAALKDTRLPFRRLWPAPVLERVDAELRTMCALDAPGREEIMGQIEADLAQEGWVHFMEHRVLEMNHSPLLQGLSLTSFGHVDWRGLWFKRSP